MCPWRSCWGRSPTRTLATISRRVATKKFGLTDVADGRETELQLLQSLDRETAERLSDENIRTMVELAYSNPVMLTMRTNLRFNAIVDYVSQALLWLYLEDDLAKVRKHGIRGAQEVRALWNDLVSADNATRTSAEETLKALADSLEMEEATLRHTLDQVAEDPYTLFLWNVWG